MANTGNVIVTERDTNPNSATYNQTRTRVYQDTTRCPVDETYDFVMRCTERGTTAVATYVGYEDTLDFIKVHDFLEGYIVGEGHSGLLDVIIGEQITTVEDAAFYGQSTIKTLKICSTVTTIGTGQYSVFEGCTNLSEVTCLGTTPPALQANAFDYAAQDLVIYVPAESVNAYKAASGWSNYSSKIQAKPS